MIGWRWQTNCNHHLIWRTSLPRVLWGENMKPSSSCTLMAKHASAPIYSKSLHKQIIDGNKHKYKHGIYQTRICLTRSCPDVHWWQNMPCGWTGWLVGTITKCVFVFVSVYLYLILYFEFVIAKHARLNTMACWCISRRVHRIMVAAPCRYRLGHQGYHHHHHWQSF